ncbi:transposase [Streptomyces sp. NPDC093250]|uniref:transposase n=1 Tax=Streptomyces sp. NPDC093250 TaxID=3366036 RepID=UPI00381DA5B9
MGGVALGVQEAGHHAPQFAAVGDNPERLGSEASFTALCGVSPVERSSGSRQYRRLNRAATGSRTRPCTGSCRPACALTRVPRTTTNAAARRSKPGAR